MEQRARKTCAVVAACGLTSTLAVPFLVLAVGGIGGSSGESCAVLPALEDAAPNILGDTRLNADDLATWWSGSGRGQPAGLDATVAELADRYIAEGETEGVRGDLAFAQAVHETGYFTSTDVSINNFAGIAHPDGSPAGWAFVDVETGVRAHIQLLKKYVAGNEVQLAAPDVSPAAGARAITWADLAQTWATDPGYWTSISRLYGQIQESATEQPPGGDTGQCKSTDDTIPPADGAAPDLRTVRGITVNATIADQVDRLLAAADADGLLLSGSGYRSHEQQIELRQAHCGSSNYAIYEMPSSQCSPPTARPGASMHEQGLAIDFANCSTQSTRCWQWLNANAADYGLYNLPSEPWHYSTNGR